MASLWENGENVDQIQLKYSTFGEELPDLHILDKNMFVFLRFCD